MKEKHRILFKPIHIGGVELKNRYVMSPMADFGLVDGGGIPTDDGVEYFVARARGGIGLIMTGTCFVDDTIEKIGTHTLMCASKTDKWKAMEQYNKMAERIHAYGGKLFVQLASGYGRSGHIPESAKEAVGPSEMPNRWKPEMTHRAMTTREVETLVEAFGEAAAFLQKCGVDGVEVHAVHEGYLLDQFTMECFNHRTDKYGGSFENRYRFAVEIVECIKSRCGKDYPVSLRYTAKHYMKGLLQGAVAGETFAEMGRDLPEGIEGARYLEKAGYDALNVDLGCYDAHYWNHPSVFQKDGLYLDAAAKIKEAVSIPVIVAGRMDNPDFAAAAITDGKCDMIGLGRPCLADAEIPKKIAHEAFEQIRPCVSCNYGCCYKVQLNSHRQSCAVNAQCGHELETRLIPTLNRRNIVVVGGGPAGCECARVAALRGHNVTLLEAAPQLGGALIPAARPSFKHHDTKLIAYFAAELKRLGVEVRLNTTATVENIRPLKPDVVVTAAGAKSFIPSIPGAEHALTAIQALMSVERVGKRVVLIGGGQVGSELAIWLLERGHEVTILESQESIMPASMYHDREHAEALLKFGGAKMEFNIRVEEVNAEGVRYRAADGTGAYREADSVILATGFRGDDSLYQALRKEFDEVYNIGDGVRSRNLYYAIHEAYDLASYL